jgi:hypothetical protein
MTENCLKVGMRCEVWIAARCVKERGARRARDWRAGNRRFLVAVRTLRLIADMIVNWFQRGDSELEKILQASPGKCRACTSCQEFIPGPNSVEPDHSRGS